jgi:hypothetical protein
MARTKARTTPALPPATNPDNVKSVYSNNMEVAIGTMDTRLTFNEVVSDQGRITVERRAHVVMSNMHFQIMVKVLVEQLPKLKEQLELVEKALAEHKASE